MVLAPHSVVPSSLSPPTSHFRPVFSLSGPVLLFLLSCGALNKLGALVPSVRVSSCNFFPFPDSLSYLHPFAEPTSLLCLPYGCLFLTWFFQNSLGVFASRGRFQISSFPTLMPAVPALETSFYSPLSPLMDILYCVSSPQAPGIFLTFARYFSSRTHLMSFLPFSFFVGGTVSLSTHLPHFFFLACLSLALPSLGDLLPSPFFFFTVKNPLFCTWGAAFSHSSGPFPQCSGPVTPRTLLI